MSRASRYFRMLLAVGCMAFSAACAKRAVTIPGVPTIASFPSIARATSPCDPTLWNHVYTGDPRKFSTPKDRLVVLQDCITVTGTVQAAKSEKDGDYHVTVDVDAPFKALLNAKNTSAQHGFLVVEPVCENPVKQADTLQEGVCMGFHQTVFVKQMIGKHVEITGAFVTDMEHGWREIHPVTSIVIK